MYAVRCMCTMYVYDVCVDCITVTVCVCVHTVHSIQKSSDHCEQRLKTSMHSTN